MSKTFRSACAVAVLCAAAPAWAQPPAAAPQPVTRIKLPKSAAGLLAGASRTPDASAFGDDSRSILGGPGRGPGAPAFVPDPAFDRYVDPLAIGRAWDALDAAALTDGSLALIEGERVLLRPHRGLPTKDVVTLAARLAAERRDEASLARLEKAAAKADRDDLKQIVTAARAAGGAGKAAAVPVDVGTVSPSQYRACNDVTRAAMRARLTGNSRYIVPIVTPEGDVVVPGTVPGPISLPLRQQVVAMCGDLPEQPVVDGAALDLLAATSRRRDDDERYFREEERRREEAERRREREEEERRRREEFERNRATDPTVVTGGY